MTIDKTAELIAKFAGIKINLERIEECIMEDDYIEAAVGTSKVASSMDALGEALVFIIQIVEGEDGVIKFLGRIVEEGSKKKWGK